MTRVAYFGTWERGYPRNEQVIAALRSVGVEVDLMHQDVWTDRHKFALRPTVLPRLLISEATLGIRRVPRDVDALIVGYPGHFDIWSAKRHGKPVIFNAMVSLFDTFVEDRRRFGAQSLAGRGLRAIDRAAFRGADVIVADTKSNARYIADLAEIDTPEVCYVGAEERLFLPRWRRPERFSVLFVGKLIPLHGLEVILEAARSLPTIPFRIIGSGQLEGLLRDLPGNVDHVAWVEYEQLPAEYVNAGCALGVFGSSPKARRVIPNKAFQALAVGTPLITASTEGVLELLRNGRDALLVDSTPEALAEAIRRLHDSSELAERIGAEGRLTFEREASESVLGDKWRTVIETAARPGRSGR
jgi:glycosyltransferase involved in cell wall biosynthesis